MNASHSSGINCVEIVKSVEIIRNKYVKFQFGFSAQLWAVQLFI